MNPPRPPPGYIRLVNGIGGLLERARFSKPELHVDSLMRHAQKRTGLEDWGDEAFRPGLEQLVAALQEQARLSQIGRITAYFNILDLLCIRLRLIDYRGTHRAVAQQQIKKPLFILGLPRTGTTILYELIAHDPAFRSPASWEVARPLPPPTPQTYEGDRRIVTVDRALALMEKLSPGFRTIHPIGARLPQECVYLLASGFMSEQFAYMYQVPDYRAWLLAQDMTAAYRWHANFLQHLQVDLGRERWVLKTPAHLAHLKYLLAQYPDATIVWTHRQPLDAIASFSSLVCTLRGGFSRGIDPMATGESELRHYSQVVSNGMAARRALDSGQFIDVGFNAIVANPLDVVCTIYKRCGMELSREAEMRMREYLQRHPRHLYGKHQYSREAFGLDEAAERTLYSEYLSQYGDFLGGD